MAYVLLVALCAPLVCAIAISVLPVAWWRGLAVACGAFEAALALVAFFLVGADTLPHFVVHYEWIPSLGIAFYLGLDGLSAALLLSIALVYMAALYAARERGECLALLCAAAGSIGAVVARDFFLYCFFCELAVWPLCLLVALRGGLHRESAAVQFSIHSLLGGALLLFAAVSAVSQQRQMGVKASLAIEQIAGVSWPLSFQFTALVACAIAFALRSSIFPFHSWAMTWHRAAGRSASMVVVGSVLPLSAYGLLRYALPLCADALGAWQAIALPLLIASITAAAFSLLAERDALRQLALVASCQMAWIALGISALDWHGLQGAAIIAIGSGAVVAVLSCLLVRSEDGVADSEQPPRRWGILWAVLALAGLPGLGLFPGYFLVGLAGVGQWGWWIAPLALAALLCAVWALRFFAQMGRSHEPYLGRSLYLLLLPLVLYSCAIGLYPSLIRYGELAAAKEVVATDRDNEGAPAAAVDSLSSLPGVP